MEIALILLYCGLFLLPYTFLNFLQYRHIQRVSQSEPILLSSKDYRDAAEYAKAKLRLGVIEAAVGAILFAFWVIWGLHFLNVFTACAFVLEVSDYAFIVLSFLIISQILSLPFKYYLEMVLDKQFGFSKRSNRLFFLDFLKGLVLTFILGGAVIYGLVFLIDQVKFWWLWSALFVIGVVVIVNLIYPTLIAPLFYSFVPLKDQDLKERIDALLQSVGFESEGVFVMDASKRDGRLNAYFGGLGRSKRVVLFDTLLEKISTEGLMAILGHELGHFKAKDIWRNIFLQGFFLFCLFFAVGTIDQWLFNGLRLEKNPGNLLVLVILIAPVISFWFLPIIGFFSRKAEFRADAFGASLVSKRALAEALVRLINENKAFPSSHFLYIFFHYTHPPLLERLKALDYEI